VSAGAVKEARRDGRMIPGGAMLDAEGRPTEDPERRAALTPFGGAKGSALAFAVQGLSLLAGAPAVPERGDDYGFSLVAIDPQRFAGAEGLRGAMDELGQRLHALTPREGEAPPRAPGERAFAERARRLEEGVPVDPEVWSRLCRLAEE
jgi:LDH2 family malate/lactate/ureidoglycolate dehydrogenase